MIGLKYDGGKPRVDLIEAEFILGMGKLLGFGAEKYAEDSWQGLPDAEKRYKAALLRHVLQYQGGEEIDEESGLTHLWHAAVNLMFLDFYRRQRLTKED